MFSFLAAESFNANFFVGLANAFGAIFGCFVKLGKMSFDDFIRVIQSIGLNQYDYQLDLLLSKDCINYFNGKEIQTLGVLYHSIMSALGRPVVRELVALPLLVLVGPSYLLMSLVAGISLPTSGVTVFGNYFMDTLSIGDLPAAIGLIFYVFALVFAFSLFRFIRRLVS